MRRYLTITQKLRILDEGELGNLSTCQLALLHGLQTNQIRKWKESKPRMEETRATKSTLHAGKKSDFDHWEAALVEYVRNRRASKAGNSATLTSVVTVRSIIEELQRLSGNRIQKPFEHLQMWAYRFLSRNRLSIRRISRKTSISDNELQTRMGQFLTMVGQIKRTNPDMVFINMDQTAVYYNPVSITTVDFVGAVAVQAATNDQESQRVTVALTIGSNGEKLRPFVVFKGCPGGRISRELAFTVERHSDVVRCAVQPNAWFDEEIMLIWIDQILIPFIDIHDICNLCLVLDSFSCHRTQRVTQRFMQLGLSVIFIPGGLTPYLQPLDIGVNSPFKHWLREEFAKESSTANLSPPQKRDRVLLRILGSWASIEADTVRNAFNHMFLHTGVDETHFEEVMVESPEVSQ
jgi:hypothetical protein